MCNIFKQNYSIFSLEYFSAGLVCELVLDFVRLLFWETDHHLVTVGNPLHVYKGKVFDTSKIKLWAEYCWDYTLCLWA